ncbi:phosphotransferase enzyme family protein [Actinoalloteichus fjordicus]|uniref:Phosphotransferase family protein n=1 Tax=Actinoalloteichus fjordicus TaxID=1612552 RepID=A0AAC9LCC7_9PSEU|nr:phosphotransferase [Actinoalloteichus fjordicus]APU14982.1 phosphotransferase family protein [Actinoalloteichus fjordicus]
MCEEEPLTGGNVSASVVRVGDTVRKPAVESTASVAAFLAHLRDAGFPHAPSSAGIDERGRHVLEYVPATMSDRLPPMTVPELRRLGGLIRLLHDTAETFVPSDEARWDVVIPPDRVELICHHDLAPWNLVRDGDRWVFIDWDGAGPGSRLWDLAYAAHGFVPLHPGGDPDIDAPRLRALADGYGLDAEQRAALPVLIVDHVRGMHDLLVEGARTGRQPWARLHAEGHARHWGPAAEYVRRHLDVWRQALIMSPDAAGHRTMTPESGA